MTILQHHVLQLNVSMNDSETVEMIESASLQILHQYASDSAPRVSAYQFGRRELLVGLWHVIALIEECRTTVLLRSETSDLLRFLTEREAGNKTHRDQVESVGVMEGGRESQQEWITRYLAHDALFFENRVDDVLFFDDGIRDCLDTTLAQALLVNA